MKRMISALAATAMLCLAGVAVAEPAQAVPTGPNSGPCGLQGVYDVVAGNFADYRHCGSASVCVHIDYWVGSGVEKAWPGGNRFYGAAWNKITNVYYVPGSC